MTEKVALSLRAWPTKETTPESLPSLIARINEQRGGFRNLTEQSLKDEIRAQYAGESTVDEASAKPIEHDEKDLKSRREEVIEARDEILKYVAQAQMESAYALDFVSLLLSKHTPRQADLTMSPYLKQNVPSGSLGVEVVQLPQVTEAQKHDAELVSTGWKLQSLNDTADSLLRSATRLEKEMEQEARYWEQVLAVREKGWSICRLPRERHTLGVRYGFAEAAPEFRDRGLAALRRDEEGNINLDLGIRSLEPQSLRVRIKHKGTIIASAISIAKDMTSDESVDKLLLQARNSIYDGELHHELHREARTLVNQGVRCIGEVIYLPYENDKYVLLDLVSYGDAVEMSEEGAQEDSIVARAVALAARLLLSHAHRMNLRRRSQPPPPLTERRPPRPTYLILRLILSHLQHRSRIAVMRGFLGGIRKILAAAGLPFEYNEAASMSSDLPDIPAIVAKTGIPLAEVLGDSLSTPSQSRITLVLPSQSTNIVINVRTHLSAPHFGTDYPVTIESCPPSSATSKIPGTMIFFDASAAEDHLLHLLTLDLVFIIASTRFSNLWAIRSPQTGELRMAPKGKERGKWMFVIAERLKLEVQWGLSIARSEIKNHVWRADDEGNEGAFGRTLEDVVREAGTGTPDLSYDE